jgi:hypothetical protein
LKTFSFLTTLNIQDEGNEDEHNELETEHPKPLTVFFSFFFKLILFRNPKEQNQKLH